MTPLPNAFIWTDSHGKGRNRYALFRRVFHLTSPPPADCKLNLFADSRYRLIVNGQTIGHGPARFFVSSPEFDTYDLTPHLHPGTNVIAVIVNSFNAVTFQSDVSTGGLCMWSAGLEISTDDGNWKAIESPGHNPQTHYLSFALNPAECLDDRAMPIGWEFIAFDDSSWKPATIRENCKWGTLQPRSIPLLDESAVRPKQQLGMWSATPIPGETIYSLLITTTGGNGLHTNARVAVLTYLHSPRAQQMILGSWWGKHWINGVEIKGHNRADVQMRQDFPCHLKQGWNTLLVFEKVNYDYFDFTLGIPESSGVEISATREIGSPHTFLIGGPWEDEHAAKADAQAWPLKSLPTELGKWKPWERNQSSPFPMKQRGWRTFTRLDEAEWSLQRPPLAAQAATPLNNHAIALLFEFPGEVIGRPRLDFTASAGTIIDLCYTERLRPDGTADLHRDPWGIHMADRYIAKAGRQQIHTFHPRGLKYLEVLITGDVYAFSLHDLGLTRANYPVTFTGKFECSDPMLQKIWAMGRDTQLACMEDAYLDCPWRERGLYAGDLLVQFPVALACFGDGALARRSLKLFLLSQDSADNGLIAGGAFGLPAGRHPDYSAIVLIALHDYWARTGDIAGITRLLPRIKRLARGLANLTSVYPVLLDGSDLHPYIDNCHMDKSGINCALNCFYQRSFHCVAELFKPTNEPQLAAEYHDRAAQLSAAIRTQFWDESRGVFTDRLKTDRPDTQPSVPANTLPLLWDIASPSQAERALPWLVDAMADNFRVPNPTKSADLNVNAYFSFYALGTLYKFGKTVEAEAFIRREWGRMIDAGAWTCWEYFIDSNSRCHAWSAAPTHYLSTEILGIQFPEPGNPNKITINPKPGTLKWARGIYPHPAGPIHVSWHLEGDALHVSHQFPSGVTFQTNEETR